jgi:hypothetical protein
MEKAMGDTVNVSSADGHSEVRGTVSLEFGNESQIARWRGVSVGGYPRAEITLDPATMPLTLDEECLQVCTQIKAMLDEERTAILKQIISRYETYRRSARATVDVHEQDEDFARRLHAMLDRLGITEHGF